MQRSQGRDLNKPLSLEEQEHIVKVRDGLQATVNDIYKQADAEGITVDQVLVKNKLVKDESGKTVSNGSNIFTRFGNLTDTSAGNAMLSKNWEDVRDVYEGGKAM